MASLHDFDWWEARIEPARVESKTPGKRSYLGWCPVHGGSDSLHVTEKGAKVLVKCFGCEATYGEIVSAIEATPIKITRTTRRRGASPRAVPSDAKADPLAWYAAYCGVAREFLDGLPLSATSDGWVSHDFPGLGVAKQRQAGTADRRWTPADSHNPAIWPLEDAMPSEILLTEGESDAIALRGIGYDMAYSAGSASGVPSVSDFRSIARRGVGMVFVAYDADEAGQKGAEKAMEHAMTAGLSAARIVPPDYDSLTGRGKDWREWLLNGGDPDNFPASNLGQVIKSVATIRNETPSSVPWAAFPVAYFGGVSVLAGPAKGGKSTLLGHLMRCAETGEKFLGEYDVKAATPVLLMTEEQGIPVVVKMDAFGLKAMEVVQRGDAVRAGWGLADSLAAAARWIRTNPRGVIAIDTLAVWASIENENDAGETTAAIETIRHALADRDAAVILVHHTRKGGGIAGEATRGSSAIAAACDVQAELTYVNPEDPTDSRRRLTVRGRVMETINLLVTYDTSTHAYTLEDSSDEENAELLSWIEGVPRLADDPDGISQKDLEALWGLNEGGGQKRVKKLIATTLLRQSDDLVKVGRGRERRYWRADFDVRHGPTNRDTTDELAVGISVDGETGVTAPKGRSHARGTEIPRYEGIGGIPVVGGDEPSVKGQRATKGKA